MGKVILLPEEIRNKIAAGEVVERPASVVKELVENSIDAGAKRVLIEIINGGETLISVLDDGEGMSREDAILALNRYATSKIKSEEDLYNIKTLGFRGEALASIASVSKMEIRTKTENEEGVFIKVEGGIIKEVQSWEGAKGTSIRVYDLFYNVPARKKFLKSKSTETNLIVDFVKKAALAFPEIGFHFIQDGKNKFITSGNSKIEDVIIELLDIRDLNSLIFFENKKENYVLKGIISKPGKLLSLKPQDYFFVNRRWIRNNQILQAVKEAYKGRLLEGYYPLTILFLFVPYNEIDVNVHPTKKEIKFEREKEIISFVEDSIRSTLQVHDEKTYSSFVISDKKSQKQDINSYLNTSNYDVVSIPLPFEEVKQNLAEKVSEVYFSVKPEFRIIGQVFDNYIIVETKDKILIIDQHAAHERVKYEELKGKVYLGSIQNVEVLFPIIIEVTNEEKELLNKNKNILEKFAFYWEDLGPYHIRLLKVPYDFLNFDSQSIENLFREIIEDINEKDLSLLEDKVIKSMACHSVIRSGNILIKEEMETLIRLIFERKIPLTCPHGRPFIWEIKKEDLEKYFHRR